jgi:hypothetical protein
LTEPEKLQRPLNFLKPNRGFWSGAVASDAEKLPVCGHVLPCTALMAFNRPSDSDTQTVLAGTFIPKALTESCHGQHCGMFHRH